MKDLASVSRVEQNIFFNSFDHILCGIDGVLWRSDGDVGIPYAKSAITSLKNLNKRITFVSNNTSKSQDDFYQQLKTAGFNLEKCQVIQPIQAIVAHFKKINFTKEIFLIGMAPLRTALVESEFTIFEYDDEVQLEILEELDVKIPPLTKYLRHCLKTNDKVGAFVIDCDLNLTQHKLQNGATHLTNPDVLLITGFSDLKLCEESGVDLIGPGVFQKIVEDISGRVPVHLAKPSPEYGEFVKEKCGIRDSKRVLVIGDSILEDMGFAANCGFQKLLVLSGLAKKENLNKWGLPGSYKPQYYVDSLKTIYEIISSDNFNE